jgi:hypothetical protein
VPHLSSDQPTLTAPRMYSLRKSQKLVWCLRNSYTFVGLKLAWGEARGRECIRSDTRPTEQRSPRPISAQPGGRHVFWAEALLLAPYRSTAGYARRSRLASAQNPLPRMYSYFGDTTLVGLETAMQVECNSNDPIPTRDHRNFGSSIQVTPSKQLEGFGIRWHLVCWFPMHHQTH